MALRIEARAEQQAELADRESRGNIAVTVGPRRQYDPFGTIPTDSVTFSVKVPLGGDKHAEAARGVALRAAGSAAAERGQLLRRLEIDLHEAEHALTVLEESAALAAERRDRRVKPRWRRSPCTRRDLLRDYCAFRKPTSRIARRAAVRDRATTHDSGIESGTGGSPMRNEMLRKSLLASGCLVIAGLATAASDRFAVTDQQLERLGVTLRVAEVVDTIEYAAAPAEVVVPPARQALVNASHGGVIVRLLVAEGDAVTAGQVVAELDSLDYVEHQRNYIDALAAFDLAAAQAARDRGLFEDGIIAERRVAESGAAANAARARVDHLRAELELAGLTDADLARLVERRELGKRIVLRAPFSGVVTAVHAQIGSRVDVLDPVAAIADLGELWLELNVSQERAARIVPGMLASAVAGGVAVNGTITTIGGVVDAVTQTVLVRAVVDNKGGMLRPDSFWKRMCSRVPEAWSMRCRRPPSRV
jgi:RND family efflux transporter MFP subunit